MIINYILAVLVTAIAILRTARYNGDVPSEYDKTEWWMFVVLSVLFPLGVSALVVFWTDTYLVEFLTKERRWFWRNDTSENKEPTNDR